MRIDLNPGSVKPQRHGRPHAGSFNGEDEEKVSPSNLMTPLVENSLANPTMSGQNRIGSKPPTNSSQSQLLTDGPLNTYQDFRNVFNAKHLGPKSNRRQAHAPTYLSSENLKENEERSIRSSSHSIKGTG